MKSFSDLTLATPRLRLRPLAREDAASLYAINSDPLVMRYGCSGAWTTMQQAVDHIERDLKSLATGEAVQFGLFRATDDTLLGTSTLFHFDEQCRRAEIGYQLAVSAWGQGFASESVTALLHYAFDELALNRIEADIDPRNTASARLLDRFGFVHEGHLRQRWIIDGEVSDSSIYGLLAQEWRAAH